MRPSSISLAILAFALATSAACQDKAKPAATGSEAGKSAPSVDPKEASMLHPDRVPVPRKIPINVKREGYDPSRVEARGGEVITLVFTRTEDGGCGDVVQVQGTNLRADLPLNKPVALTITLPRSGELVFACGMDMMHGIVSITPAS